MSRESVDRLYSQSNADRGSKLKWEMDTKAIREGVFKVRKRGRVPVRLDALVVLLLACRGPSLLPCIFHPRFGISVT